MPVYNVEDYLRQCIDSVLNQTMRDIELICVDDGSTEGSAAILAEYAAKDARVKVMAREHSNAGAARNAGMSVASGEWLFFSDADDFLGAEMLSRMTTADGADAADMVIAGHRTLENGVISTNRISARLLKHREAGGGPCPPWLFLDAGVMPWNKLFRRSFVRDRKLSFQEVPRHNDMLFVCCALASAKEVAVSNTCGYVYRRRRSGGITESASRHGGFLFADVLQALRSELEKRGLLATALQAYGNLALAHCYYHLLGEFDPVSFVALYSELHGHLLADFGLTGADKSAFVNKKHCEYMQATLSDETPLSLWMILLRERYSSWRDLCSRNERISGLQKKVFDAEGRVGALQSESEALKLRVSEKDRRIGDLDRSVKEKAGLLDEANRQIAELRGRLQVEKSSRTELAQRLEAVLGSRSYRLGRVVTWPFRALFGRRRADDVRQKPLRPEADLLDNC